MKCKKLVIKYYPTAHLVKLNELYEIQIWGGIILGIGKTKYKAWKDAFKKVKED